MGGHPHQDAARFVPRACGECITTPRIAPRQSGCRIKARSAQAVHPRACGERGSRTNSGSRSSGSSPRGGERCQPNSPTQIQIGSSPPCWERVDHADSARSFPGSSLRARGTPDHLPARPCAQRFIPARAGNATKSPSRPLPNTVHPRACGERLGWQIMGFIRTGSSPRVRGTRPQSAPDRRRARFIPARAGNAPTTPPRPTVSPVHPRACGERLKKALDDLARTGSSPRVRGTPPLVLGEIQVADDSHQAAVHPRACGERAASRAARSPIFGSSPRVRGTLGPSCAALGTPSSAQSQRNCAQPASWAGGGQ
jgi:hypothetical protein